MKPFNLRALVGIQVQSKTGSIATISSVRDRLTHEYQVQEGEGEKHWTDDEGIVALLGIKPHKRGTYKSRSGKKPVQVCTIRTERKGVRFRLTHEQYGVEGDWMTWHDLKFSEVVLHSRRTVVGGVKFDRSPLMEQLERIQEEQGA